MVFNIYEAAANADFQRRIRRLQAGWLMTVDVLTGALCATGCAFMALDDYGAASELGAEYPGNPADPWRWRALYLLVTVGYAKD